MDLNQIDLSQIGIIALHLGASFAAVAWGIKQLLSAMVKSYDNIIAAQTLQITTMQQDLANDRANCAAEIKTLKDRITYLESLVNKNVPTTTTIVQLPAAAPTPQSGM